MKTSTKLSATAVALTIAMGGGLYLSNSAYAAAVGLTQADFTFEDAACTTHTPNAKGISCYDVSGVKYYQISAGEYKLDGDVNLGTGAAFTSGDSFSLDLNGKTLSASSTNPVIELDSTNNTISGSGAITNNTSDISFTARGEYSGATLVSRSNVTINGGTFGAAGFYGTNTTINGGTFTGGEWSMAVELSETNGKINGGTFSAAGASAMYFNQGADSTLEINGGSFTSAGDNGIEIMDGVKDLKITGGTFTGKVAGIAFDMAPTAAALSGGTYIATGTDEYSYGGIVMWSQDNTNALSSLLAAGASYSDGNAAKGGTDPNWFVYLTNKRVTIGNGSIIIVDPTAEEASTASATVGAPNSGFSTKETSAATSIVASILAAGTLVASIFGIRKFIKR